MFFTFFYLNTIFLIKKICFDEFFISFAKKRGLNQNSQDFLNNSKQYKWLIK